MRPRRDSRRRHVGAATESSGSMPSLHRGSVHDLIQTNVDIPSPKHHHTLPLASPLYTSPQRATAPGKLGGRRRRPASAKPRQGTPGKPTPRSRRRPTSAAPARKPGNLKARPTSAAVSRAKLYPETASMAGSPRHGLGKMGFPVTAFDSTKADVRDSTALHVIRSLPATMDGKTRQLSPKTTYSTRPQSALVAMRSPLSTGRQSFQAMDMEARASMGAQGRLLHASDMEPARSRRPALAAVRPAIGDAPFHLQAWAAASPVRESSHQAQPMLPSAVSPPPASTPPAINLDVTVPRKPTPEATAAVLGRFGVTGKLMSPPVFSSPPQPGAVVEALAVAPRTIAALDASRGVVPPAVVQPSPAPTSLREFARNNYWRFRRPLKSGVLLTWGGRPPPGTATPGRPTVSWNRVPPFPFTVTPGGDVQPGPGKSRTNAALVDDPLADAPPAPDTTLDDAVLPVELVYKPHSFVFRPRLDLSTWSTRVTDATVVQVAPALPDLLSLNMSGCTQVGTVGWVTNLPLATRLRSLDLAGCPRVTDAALQRLALVCTTLRRLDVSGTSVTSAGLDAVSKTCVNLQWVSCVGCGGVRSLAWAARLSQLQHADMGGCPVDGSEAPDLLAACGALHTLRVSETSLTGDALAAMARRGPTSGLGVFAAPRCSALSPAGVNRLAGVASGLHTVDLSHCFEWPVGALARLVATLPHLSQLSLEACGLTDAHCVEVAAATQLLSLHLDGNTGMTSAGLQSIGSSCRKLVSVSVAGCHAVDDDGVRRLVRSLRGRGLDCTQAEGVCVAQSSTWRGSGALGALRREGPLPADAGLTSGSVTGFELQPWWEVGFAAPRQVATVVLHHGMHTQSGLDLHLLFSTERLGVEAMPRVGRAHRVVVRGSTLLPDVHTMALDDPITCQFVRIVATRPSAMPWRHRAPCRLVLHRVAVLETSLRALNVSRTAVTDVAMGNLAANLPFLRQLRVAGCAVSDTALLEVVRACNSLRVLDVGASTAITPQLLSAVGVSLPRLEELHASAWTSPEARNRGQAAMAPPTPGDTTLAKVSGVAPEAAAVDATLRRWGVDDAGLGWLARGCPNLRVLDVAGQVGVTDAGTAFLHTLHALDRVDTTAANGVTDGGLQALAASADRLVFANAGGFRGVLSGNQAAVCKAKAAGFVRQAAKDWRAATVVQRWWRTVRAFLLLQVHMGLSSHKTMEAVMARVPYGATPADQAQFFAVGWAARTIGRAWRQWRFRVWRHAALVVEGAYRQYLYRLVDAGRVRHEAATTIQARVRGGMGRAAAVRRRAAGTAINRFYRLRVHLGLCRWWRRWYALRRRGLGRRIWRWYHARLLGWVQARRFQRTLVLSLTFWLANVNLRYLWGRTFLDAEARKKCRREAATAIQRAWVYHVVRGSAAHGWAFADTALKKRQRRRREAAAAIQAWVRRSWMRQGLEAASWQLHVHTQAALVLQRYWRGGLGRQSSLARRMVVLAEQALAYDGGIAKWFRGCRLRNSHTAVRNGLARWAVRARHSLRCRMAARLRQWWAAWMLRRRCRFRNRQALLYQSARAYSRWAAAHPNVARPDDPHHPERNESDLPLGLGDFVRCRYAGGIQGYAGEVVGVEWPDGRVWDGKVTTHPASYSVRFVRDGVVDKRCLRAWMTITRGRMVASMLNSAALRKTRSLWKTPPEVQVRPKTTTRLERLRVQEAMWEAKAEYHAHSVYPNLVGVIDVRIVVGLEANGFMEREQDLRRMGGEELYCKAALNLRDRCAKGWADDREPVHLWYLTGNTGPYLMDLAVLSTDDVLTGSDHGLARMRALRSRKFSDVVWPNARQTYPMRMFMRRSTAPDVHFPHEPPHRVKLCLAARFGMAATPADGAPVTDVETSSPYVMQLFRRVRGIQTQPMLFSRRFFPLPEDLGGFGLDAGGQVWIRHGSSKKRRVVVLAPEPVAITPATSSWAGSTTTESSADLLRDLRVQRATGRTGTLDLGTRLRARTVDTTTTVTTIDLVPPRGFYGSHSSRPTETTTGWGSSSRSHPSSSSSSSSSVSSDSSDPVF